MCASLIPTLIFQNARQTVVLGSLILPQAKNETMETLLVETVVAITVELKQVGLELHQTEWQAHVLLPAETD